MSDLDPITGPNIDDVAELVGILQRLRVSPTHLYVDWHHTSDHRPDVRIHLKTRTDFERFTAELKVKPNNIRQWQADQVRFEANHDTATRRLLIGCVSFPHHDDWEAKS